MGIGDPLEGVLSCSPELPLPGVGAAVGGATPALAHSPQHPGEILLEMMNSISCSIPRGQGIGLPGKCSLCSLSPNVVTSRDLPVVLTVPQGFWVGKREGRVVGLLRPLAL